MVVGVWLPQGKQLKGVGTLQDGSESLSLNSEYHTAFNMALVLILLGPAHRNCRLSIATKNRSFFYRSVKFPVGIVRKHDTRILSATRKNFSNGIR